MFHDLRHTFGTSLADAGVDVVKIKELMGHASIVTTMRYMHATAQGKRGARKLSFQQLMTLGNLSSLFLLPLMAEYIGFKVFHNRPHAASSGISLPLGQQA